MISYELAKQLKDAGFSQVPTLPFDGFGQFYIIGDPGIIIGPTPKYREYIYFPTLEEFIDACGDKFSYLSQKHGGWQANSIFIVKDNVADQEEWIGKTPLEAVANLWLALNKK